MHLLKLFFVLVFYFSFGLVSAATSFVYCSEESPKTFNPQIATDGPTFNASSRPIYNRLVDFEHGGTKVVPSLAESWQVDAKGLNYTFKLRKGVKFHTTENFKPTRHFNADDVIFSFDRMRLKEHRFHKVGGGIYEYFAGMNMGATIKDILKVDESTVRFVLNKPEAPFLANLAMDFASILSQEYALQLERLGKTEKIDTEPVGTGPFVLHKYVKDNIVRFKKHPEYFGGPAKIENLIFAITPDANVRFQKLKAGECHFIAEPAPADLQQIEKLKGFKIMSEPGLNVGYLAMNTQKKPFDNVMVRQAVNMALNRQQYIDAIYLGNARIAKNPIPPSMWSYNDSINDYEYNPAKARELLKRAGYPNGFETELWTLPVSRPYNPNGKKMGEMMQADLERVGIKAKLVTYKWAEYLKRGSQGEHALMQVGWSGDNGDPDNFLQVLLGCEAIEAGSNYSRWCERSFQTHIEKAKRTANQKEREKFYREAQKVFKQNAPWVTLAHGKVFKAMSEKVTGYKLSPFGTESFYEVDLRE